MPRPTIATVTFEIQVEMDWELIMSAGYDPENVTEDELRDAAIEIVHSAPGFDFVRDTDELQFAGVEWEEL